MKNIKKYGTWGLPGLSLILAVISPTILKSQVTLCVTNKTDTDYNIQLSGMGKRFCVKGGTCRYGYFFPRSLKGPEAKKCHTVTPTTCCEHIIAYVFAPSNQHVAGTFKCNIEQGPCNISCTLTGQDPNFLCTRD